MSHRVSQELWYCLDSFSLSLRLPIIVVLYRLHLVYRLSSVWVSSVSFAIIIMGHNNTPNSDSHPANRQSPLSWLQWEPVVTAIRGLPSVITTINISRTQPQRAWPSWRRNWPNSRGTSDVVTMTLHDAMTATICPQPSTVCELNCNSNVASLSERRICSDRHLRRCR